MLRRERERESRGMKTGKGVNGGVSGWKKRARTEHSRRRCRRPMKKSLVAPAGLANILLSNTGATHTHPHSVHPSRNHYTVPFLSRGVANGGGKEETRGEETGRKSVGGREGRENSRERGRGVALGSMKTPRDLFVSSSFAAMMQDASPVQRTFVRYFRDRRHASDTFFSLFVFFFLSLAREISLNSIARSSGFFKLFKCNFGVIFF